MIYDAIAANRPSTLRLAKTREFLKSDRGIQIRNDWLIDEQKPEQVARQYQRYEEWEKLAIPSSEQLAKIVARIPGSWAIQFTFTLATPYLSKGIEAFDLLDNPIIRDKVYEVPIVPASSWKGGLRSAAMQHIFGENIDSYMKAVQLAKALKEGQKTHWDERLCQLVRIFGIDRGIEHDHSAGRLHCFPTGFKATRCEVINPHDRARRVGTIPILLECVPANEQGTFTVLYVPFGEVKAGEAAADLELCAQAIRDLLLEWGIGAKKSNGNGLARDALSEGYITTMRVITEPMPPIFPEHANPYLDQDGPDAFKPSRKDWRAAHKATNAEEDRYAEARNAYRAYQDAQVSFATEHAKWQQNQGGTPVRDSVIGLEDLATKAQSGVAVTTMANGGKQ